jgi:hypothetical protein
METIKKVYITKYALTEGIIEREDVAYFSDTDRIGVECNYLFKLQYFHGQGKEWHRTKEAAIERAEEMRKMEIEDLKKSIKRLERMNFE